MDNISGIGFNNINPANNPDKAPANNQEAQAQVFNPSAQVLPAQTAHVGQALINMKQRKRNGAIDENNSEKENETHEIDVETLGLIKITDEQLQRFAERVAGGILLQEKEILDTVGTFSKNEKTLRSAIGSILLS